MGHEDTELLFPPRLIPVLRDLRGDAWRELVDKIFQQEKNSLDRLAFVLMMSRLDGCSTCQADSFRAMRGCTQCAMQTIRRYRGSDQDLLDEFSKAKDDVYRYMNNGREKG